MVYRKLDSPAPFPHVNIVSQDTGEGSLYCKLESASVKLALTNMKTTLCEVVQYAETQENNDVSDATIFNELQEIDSQNVDAETYCDSIEVVVADIPRDVDPTALPIFTTMSQPSLPLHSTIDSEDIHFNQQGNYATPTDTDVTPTQTDFVSIGTSACVTASPKSSMPSSSTPTTSRKLAAHRVKDQISGISDHISKKPRSQPAANQRRTKWQAGREYLSSQLGLPDLPRPINGVEMTNLFNMLKPQFTNLEGGCDFQGMQHEWNETHVRPTMQRGANNKYFVPGPIFPTNEGYLREHAKMEDERTAYNFMMQSMPFGAVGYHDTLHSAHTFRPVMSPAPPFCRVSPAFPQPRPNMPIPSYSNAPMNYDAPCNLHVYKTASQLTGGSSVGGKASANAKSLCQVGVVKHCHNCWKERKVETGHDMRPGASCPFPKVPMPKEIEEERKRQKALRRKERKAVNDFESQQHL